nr:retrovirus-related Pol polyprotein from transposon TNT 1-94 [Tanacetum cinerariifolium]
MIMELEAAYDHETWLKDKTVRKLGVISLIGLAQLEKLLVDYGELKSTSDCSNGDNACTSNTMEPKIKQFPNSTSLLGRFMGTVRFENDHVAVILCFGDLQWGNILITKVYFVEGLGQFCDSDLEVAFRKDVCFIRNLKGVDLLKGYRSTNLYTINLHEMASASPICLMARASSTKSWLWHQRLSHLNFDTINDLAKNDLVVGLPKFKYQKEHLCPSCEQGKSKRSSHPPKPVPNSRQRLHLLHMDLCGPMRIASINGKRYVLVIVDDYSRYTWVHFLRSKDEAPEVIIKFLKRITLLLQSLVIIIRTDNGTEFKNLVLKKYFDYVGISHQMSSVRILRSKDEAPEVIKTFLKRITILFQSPVIIIRTDNGTKFKNQVLKEYFETVGISH